ncbi:MAG: hypothetical protein M1371_10010 [Actinobacteria bacterium]|nr:hypothetical protein [Actinomycetota bacterium]
MEKREKLWFGFLIIVAVAFNAITLSPLVPWQTWSLWSRPVPEQSIFIEVEDYQMKLPSEGIELKTSQFVEFVATSRDVTYGFGVFRKDGSLVFQMQVIPGHYNKILWKFDAPGLYDVRSTEYSGPGHPKMFIEDAINVTS